MVMRFVILKPEKLILQRFTGELTFDVWLKSAEAIWQHPDYEKYYRGVVDFRFTDVQMGVPEIRSIVELISNDNDKALRGSAVVLIDEPKAAAFASIFAGSIEELLHTRIVTTEEGAAAKFGFDPSVFKKLEGQDAVVIDFDDFIHKSTDQ